VTEGFLKDIGCSVTCVADGRTAVTRASSGAFDLILMDLQMPDIDGLTATAMIRRTESVGGGRRTPIIAVTANASATHREACLAAGMDDFLGKPLLYENLREMLKRWMPDHVRAIESPPPARGPAPTAPTAPARPPLDAELIAGIRDVSRRGQSGLFTRLVQAFSSSSRRQIEGLRTALGRGDLPAAAAACHALKGGAGNVGAWNLAAAAREIETACIAGDGTAAERLALELDRLHGTALSALEAEALQESA
jgi:CheY-like chemotaxis protein/HPt (histidine-containing phosphotransfer) domain-containing protein